MYAVSHIDGTDLIERQSGDSHRPPSSHDGQVGSEGSPPSTLDPDPSTANQQQKTSNETSSTEAAHSTAEHADQKLDHVSTQIAETSTTAANDQSSETSTQSKAPTTNPSPRQDSQVTENDKSAGSKPADAGTQESSSTATSNTSAPTQSSTASSAPASAQQSGEHNQASAPSQPPAPQAAQASRSVYVHVTFTWKHGAMQNVYITGSFNRWAHKIPLTAQPSPSDAEGPSEEDVVNGQYTQEQLTAIKEAQGKAKGVSSSEVPSGESASSAGWIKRWAITLAIPPGQYYFKYIVDGQWRHDPLFSHRPDPNGNMVNTLLVTAPASVISPPQAAADRSSEASAQHEDGSASLTRQAKTTELSASQAANQNTSDAAASATVHIHHSHHGPQLDEQRIQAAQSFFAQLTEDYTQFVPSADVFAAFAPPVERPALLKQNLLGFERPRGTEAFLMPIPDHVTFNHLYHASMMRRFATLQPFQLQHEHTSSSASSVSSSALPGSASSPMGSSPSPNQSSSSSSTSPSSTPVLPTASLQFPSPHTPTPSSSSSQQTYVTNTNPPLTLLPGRLFGVTQRFRRKAATVLLVVSAPRSTAEEKEMTAKSAELMTKLISCKHAHDLGQRDFVSSAQS